MNASPVHRLALAALAAAAGVGLAQAQPAGTTVSPLTVVPGPGPQVAASYPAQGSSVPAGVLVLKVTFNQPMTADGWSYAKADGGDFPNCLGRPRLLNDKKTFSLLCTVAPKSSFAVSINPASRFASADGRSAAPTVLKFSTTDVDTRDMHTALTQAGLTDTDDPVMTWRDDGKGASDSPGPPQ